jgi:uncharacterized protein
MTARETLREEVLELPRRQAASLQSLGHRPWPPPRAPWVMGQSWCDLLFAHWIVDADALARFIPAPLRLETYGGNAWLGVTPFVLRGMHARLTPPLPPLSSFCETNVRTYVTFEGRPGIFFLTLEASSRAAVAGGRVLAALPYRHARMRVERHADWIEYVVERTGLRMRARYAASGRAAPAEPGTLAAFLVERYCLYATRAGLLWRLDVHHRPWMLHEPRPGSAMDVDARQPRIPPLGTPLLHVAARQDVALWAPVPVARLRRAL